MSPLFYFSYTLMGNNILGLVIESFLWSLAYFFYTGTTNYTGTTKGRVGYKLKHKFSTVIHDIHKTCIEKILQRKKKKL